jgi:hypothetical protein
MPLPTRSPAEHHRPAQSPSSPGPGRGIGAATAVRLAAAGHDVVVKPPAIPADAEQVAAQVRAAGG